MRPQKRTSIVDSSDRIELKLVALPKTFSLASHEIEIEASSPAQVRAMHRLEEVAAQRSSSVSAGGLVCLDAETSVGAGAVRLPRRAESSSLQLQTAARSFHRYR